METKLFLFELFYTCLVPHNVAPNHAYIYYDSKTNVQVDITVVKHHLNYSDYKIEIMIFIAEWQTKSSRGSVTTTTLCKPLHGIVSNTF